MSRSMWDKSQYTTFADAGWIIDRPLVIRTKVIGTPNVPSGPKQTPSMPEMIRVPEVTTNVEQGSVCEVC